MSIRLIAKELYDCIREVDRLEKALERAPYEQKEKIGDELRKAKAQRDYIQRLLDGQKG